MFSHPGMYRAYVHILKYHVPSPSWESWHLKKKGETSEQEKLGATGKFSFLTAKPFHLFPCGSHPFVSIDRNSPDLAFERPKFSTPFATRVRMHQSTCCRKRHPCLVTRWKYLGSCKQGWKTQFVEGNKQKEVRTSRSFFMTKSLWTKQNSEVASTPSFSTFHLQVSGWINWIFINSTRWRHSVQGCKDAEAPRHALKLMTSGCGRIVWRREKAIIHSDGAAWYILKRKSFEEGVVIFWLHFFFWHLCELELGWNHENLYNLITHKLVHSQIKPRPFPLNCTNQLVSGKKISRQQEGGELAAFFGSKKLGFWSLELFQILFLPPKKSTRFPSQWCLVTRTDTAIIGNDIRTQSQVVDALLYY